MKYADLHVHTDFSDGTFSPEEVVKCAHEKGLACIAISDHDCVDAISPAIECAKKIPIEIVPAVELTVIKDAREIHLLGYYISWKEKWFREIMRRIQDGRVKRLDKMLEKLKKFNISIDRATVMEIAGDKGSVGRLHLARALVKAKAVPSINIAFERYIGDARPCYVEDVGFEAQEALDVIKKAGGVPVLAHPATIGDDNLVRDFIKCGVRGIEAFHSDHNNAIAKKYKNMAEELGLLITGGSDCHGMGKGRVLMGTVKVPYSIVEKLKEEAGVK